MIGDHLRLVLPADPGYGRIARITASNLALLLWFDHRAVEDLRIAVDELIILLLRPEGAPGTITVDFVVTTDGLTIDASTTAGERPNLTDRAALDRFRAIVAPTVDVVSLDDDGVHAHIEKHAASA